MSSIYRFRRLLLTLLPALVMSGIFVVPPPAVHAAGGDRSAPRLLQFSQDASIGRLTVLDSPHQLFDRHLVGKPFCDCRGNVKVPASLALYLLANENIESRYQCLSLMPADTFVAAFFSRTTCGDAQMAAVGHLTGLQYLTLDGTEITDIGLGKLSGLKNLEFLDLSHTYINGEGLIKLIEAGALEKLEYLDLGSNHLSKKAVAALAKLPGLVRLAPLLLSSIRLNESACPTADKLTPAKTFKNLNLQLDQRAKAVPLEVFAPLH